MHSETAIAEPGLPSGLVLGRYRPLARLGEGGFGVVWRARDELLHRDVALKRILQSGPSDARRATREAQAAARLSHPAIVSLYEACAEGDCFYLISELVDGETLAELIAHDALEDRLTLEIGATLAQALDHAHARGVIHRDVKPHNVLVPFADVGRRGEGPVAKLTDFGGARLAGEQALTRTGDVLGTLAYMSPEQSEGLEADERTDLYSLALVLYEALCGANPVRGANPAETARRVGRPLASLSGLRGDLPEALTRALDRAVSPHPDDRGTLAQLRAQLEGALAAERRTATRRLPARAPALARRAAHDPARWVEPFVEGERHDHDFAAAALNGAALRPGEELGESRPRERSQRSAARTWAGGLQRLLWRVAVVALIAWQVVGGHFGLAVLLAAALAPILLLSRPGRIPLTAVLAPLLGLAGLAGAFPAFAAQELRWPRRAFLGALGMWWLTLAEPLIGQRLWWGAPAASRSVSTGAWEHSPTLAIAHVLGPIASIATLTGVLLWALAAVIEPWLVRGRSLLADVVLAIVWASALTLAAERLHGALVQGSGATSPHGAFLGALAAAIVALFARALRGPVARR